MRKGAQGMICCYTQVYLYLYSVITLPLNGSEPTKGHEQEQEHVVIFIFPLFNLSYFLCDRRRQTFPIADCFYMRGLEKINFRESSLKLKIDELTTRVSHSILSFLSHFLNIMNMIHSKASIGCVTAINEKVEKCSHIRF